MQGLPPGFVYSPAGQLTRSRYASRRSCVCPTRSKVFPWFFSVPEQMLSSYPKLTFHCTLLMQSSQFSYRAALQRQNSPPCLEPTYQKNERVWPGNFQTRKVCFPHPCNTKCSTSHYTLLPFLLLFHLYLLLTLVQRVRQLLLPFKLMDNFTLTS